MDEYVKMLRKHIGNAPLLLVAAGAIIYKNRKICGSVTDGGGFVYSCNICRKVCPFAEI